MQKVDLQFRTKISLLLDLECLSGAPAIESIQSEQDQRLRSSVLREIDADCGSSIPNEDIAAARSRADLNDDCLSGALTIESIQSEQDQPSRSSDHGEIDAKGGSSIPNEDIADARS